MIKGGGDMDELKPIGGTAVAPATGVAALALVQASLGDWTADPAAKPK